MNSPGQPNQPGKKPTAKRGPGVVNFAFNPGLGSAAKTLGDSFQMFRNLLALLFLSSGMLDKTHPFFRPGVRFTVADVFNETYARFDWKDKTKLPQNIFFIAVWGLLAICVLWVVLAIMSLMIGTAQAAEPEGDCILCTPEGDLATSFIKNLIEGTPIPADTEAGRPAGPVATGMIQSGLRAMLEFYSSAILAFASFILLYHIVNMVVQAAWSGKALEGSAQIWAPLRLVLAIGLLVPVSNNLNAAQLMTLKIAELGSGIATKAWNTFGEAMTNTANTPAEAERIATGTMASIHAAAQRIFLIYTCMYDINFNLGKVAADVARPADTGVGNPLAIFGGDRLVVRNYQLDPLGGSTIKYMVGDDTSKEVCGSIVRPRRGEGDESGQGVLGRLVVGGANFVEENAGLGGDGDNLFGGDEEGTAPAASRIGRRLEDLKAPIRESVAQASELLRRNLQYTACNFVVAARKEDSSLNDNYSSFEKCAGTAVIEGEVADHGVRVENCSGDGTTISLATDEVPFSTAAEGPAQKQIQCAVNNYYSTVRAAIVNAYTAQGNNGQTIIDEVLNIENSSWVEAGTYFLLVSAVQSAISSAASAGPTANTGRMMDLTDEASEHLPNTVNSGTCERGEIGGWLNWVADEQKDFICHAKYFATVAHGAVRDAMDGSNGAVMTGGLFEAGKGSIINFFAGPALNDPMGALFSFGHMLYLAAAGLILSAVAAMGAGGLVGSIPLVGGLLSSGAEAYAKMAIPLGFIALGIAFPLAFLLPILPLVRFLSAVMAWLLAIFEAVVSMPLFALAHLNPRGNTLFEPAATGYQFLFHIAIKPILLVFGMIGAILVLPIVLYALNIMFVPALDAAWGQDDVTIFTKAFFFLAYATSAYGFVNISLKAIDDLSQKSIRWANWQGYQFRDDSEKAAGDAAAFAQYATTGVKAVSGFTNDMANWSKQNRVKGQQKRQQGLQNRAENMKLAADARNAKLTDGETNLLGADNKLTAAGAEEMGIAGNKGAISSFNKRVSGGMKDLNRSHGKFLGVGGNDKLAATRADLGYNAQRGDAKDEKDKRKLDAQNTAAAAQRAEDVQYQKDSLAAQQGGAAATSELVGRIDSLGASVGAVENKSDPGGVQARQERRERADKAKADKPKPMGGYGNKDN